MFVTNSLTGGGAERATNILINALTDSGKQVSLVTVNSSGVDAVTPKCEVFELMRPWQGGIGSLVVAFLRFRTFVQKWSPDVIVLNCDAPELFGALLIGKHITVAVEHSSKPWGTRKSLGRMIRLILKFRNTKWVAVSSHLGVWPDNRRPDAWISNAVLEKIAPARIATREKVLESNHELSRLVYIGRLSIEKQPGWVLEIAKQTELPAILFGDGRLRESLSKESSLMGVAAQFPGFVKNPWILLKDGDLLILPSAFEGDGLVLIESLANNVPLLVNAIPDLLRFNLPERNYCQSPDQFVQRIRTYSEKIEDLCIPDDVTLRILRKRLPEDIAARWIEFLTKLD
jgi:GalNAc-alpha-(1->4)-GalNAc-alpha-(1->3)-diNAcBac-PP-undecaprenol alpha-1,4-N-acetyl-D-galactosaminyltransferase